MAINYQFNAKRHKVAKMRSDKRRNARIQKGIYNVNDPTANYVTDRKMRREEKKRQKKIEKKARKAEKKNKMQTEDHNDNNEENM